MKQVLSPLVVVLATAAAAPGQCAEHWLPSGTDWVTNGSVSSMTMWDPDQSGPLPPRLVIAGGFTTIGGVEANNIALWDGQNWQPLGAGVARPEGHLFAVAALAVYNGDLIATGDFWVAGGVPANRIARWNGQTWQPLSTGLQGSFSSVRGEALTVYEDELIVGGAFSSAGGVATRSLARWNGEVWQPVGFASLTGSVSALHVHEGDLIVAGTFAQVAGVGARNIARWTGTEWQALGSGLSSRVITLATINGDLIAGGTFQFAGATSTRYVARWNEFRWSPLGEGFNNHVQTLCVYRGDLVAGGAFTIADGAACNRVARWKGAAWRPCGVGVMPTTGADHVFGVLDVGDVLMVGGRFGLAGGEVAPGLARWTGGDTPWLAVPPPTAVRACSGHQAVIELVPGVGQSSLSYAWRRNGVPLADGPTGTGSDVQGSATPTLVLSQVTTADAGAYECVITNSCDSTTSAPVELSIGGACAADADCNGSVEPADIAHFIGVWIASQSDGTLAGDFDGNGTVAPSDVDAFVGAWFAALTNGC